MIDEQKKLSQAYEEDLDSRIRTIILMKENIDAFIEIYKHNPSDEMSFVLGRCIEDCLRQINDCLTFTDAFLKGKAKLEFVKVLESHLESVIEKTKALEEIKKQSQGLENSNTSDVAKQFN